jgi:2-amino-4-hydroxy-6-hydroxymethyldihydropteridine diphosphokinase
MRKEAYIGIGSNIGDRESYLRQAVQELGNDSTEVVRVSAIYETKPVGYTDQADFLNMVAVVRTALAPAKLHEHMKDIENRLGRVRDIRYGPRTVDLDLLLMDDTELSAPELTVPHPRMWERAFVLVPLLDVTKERPQLAAGIASHLDGLNGKEGVIPWSNINWPSGSARSGS